MTENPAPPSPWPRRLRWAMLLMFLVSLPALWLSSPVFRLGVYPMLYPYLSAERQQALFERVRLGERRPDIAWRMFALNHDDPEAAWTQVFDECVNLGPHELLGLEEDLIAALRDPELQGAHRRALTAAGICQMKHPRFHEVLPDFLQDSELRYFAAYNLAVNGQGDRGLPALIETLRASLYEQNSLDPGDDAPYQVQVALEALRILGPAAKPALPQIREWCQTKTWADRHALAALWVIDQDDEALARLKKLFADAVAEAGTKENENQRRNLAMQLAEIGIVDDEVKRHMIDWIAERERGVVWRIMQLRVLGPVGAPALPIVTPLLDDPDPSIRAAARHTVERIQGEAPEGLP